MVGRESERDKGKDRHQPGLHQSLAAVEGGWREAREKAGWSRRGQRKLDFITVAWKKQNWVLREISWRNLEPDGRKA